MIMFPSTWIVLNHIYDPWIYLYMVCMNWLPLYMYATYAVYTMNIISAWAEYWLMIHLGPILKPEQPSKLYKKHVVEIDECSDYCNKINSGC